MKHQKQKEVRYWFPRRSFGWGWGLPTVWQGWVVYGLFFLSMVAAFVMHELGSRPYYIHVLASVLALLIICWIKGEPPGRGQWS